jgi:predicted nucleic acid-binding protein
VIFVDTDVFMYAVGREHPLKEDARAFFLEHVESGEVLVSSAEVLQELLHAYLAVGRLATLDSALLLARARLGSIWPVAAEDVELARSLVESHPALGARDLVHLACCTRRGVARVKTYDRPLAAAFQG